MSFLEKPHRDPLMYAISIAGAVLLLPVSIHAFFLGHYVPGLAILGAVVVLGMDALAIRDLQGKLRDQTITDSLTGAFNRRHMEVRLTEAIEASRRSGGAVSLLMMDLDRFKKINDGLGHEAGDRVLQGFVTLVKRRARRLDLLFRAGGEEFVLLLPDTSETDAVKLAEALRMGVGRAGLLDETPVTVSIGVAGLDPSDSIDSWLKNAAAALYSAKSSGRNSVMHVHRTDRGNATNRPIA